MWDVLTKMRECGKDVKMRDFPHDCGMVDTYALFQHIPPWRQKNQEARSTALQPIRLITRRDCINYTNLTQMLSCSLTLSLPLSDSHTHAHSHAPACLHARMHARTHTLSLCLSLSFSLIMMVSVSVIAYLGDCKYDVCGCGELT